LGLCGGRLILCELWVCYTCFFFFIDVAAFLFLACEDSEEVDGVFFIKFILLFVHTSKDVIVCFRKSERIVQVGKVRRSEYGIEGFFS
jgi:hypothetical protein